MAVENVTKKTSFANLLCQLDFVILVKFATESAHNLVLKNENGTQRIGRYSQAAQGAVRWRCPPTPRTASSDGRQEGQAAEVS